MSNKNVILKSLSLQNFKGIKELKIEFGHETTVAGANATGKTTVFDAFTWCLFGKDSSDRTDSGRGAFTVKTVDASGKAIEKLEHEVTAVIAVDSVITTFTRRLVENWVKPRGKAETELRGNDTHYFVNGIEVKASQYSQQVAGIIEDQLFKMITNPAYFPALDWKMQSDILTSIAGGVTFEEVAAGREDFQQILQLLSGRDLDAFRQEIAYKKKTIKAELDKCPVEINAIRNVMPEAPNYAALQEEINEANAQLQDIEAAIADVASANRKAYEAVTAKKAQIAELQRKQVAVINVAKDEAQKAYFEANRIRNEKADELSSLKTAIINFNKVGRGAEADMARYLEFLRQQIPAKTAELEAKRKEWNDRAAQAYEEKAGVIVCPLYGFTCTDGRANAAAAEARKKARAAFVAKQDDDLARISDEGKKIAQRLAELQSDLQKTEEAHSAEVAKNEAQLSGYTQRAEAIEKELATMPVVSLQEVNPADLPEYVELGLQIAEIEASIAAPSEENTGSADLQQQKRNLQARIEDAKQKAAVKTTIERHTAAIAEIENREQELAQQLADVENLEYNADQLNKARVMEVERRVNSKFAFVRFRMSEPQLNGGEIPTCVATVNGVKYADLNNAMKINAGLDIINTLCRFHGVTAPIFIDNAEGVNKIFEVDSQLIKLAVTSDPELTITINR